MTPNEFLQRLRDAAKTATPANPRTIDRLAEALQMAMDKLGELQYSEDKGSARFASKALEKITAMLDEVSESDLVPKVLSALKSVRDKSTSSTQNNIESGHYWRGELMKDQRLEEIAQGLALGKMSYEQILSDLKSVRDMSQRQLNWPCAEDSFQAGVQWVMAWVAENNRPKPQ